MRPALLSLLPPLTVHTSGHRIGTELGLDPPEPLHCPSQASFLAVDQGPLFSQTLGLTWFPRKETERQLWLWKQTNLDASLTSLLTSCVLLARSPCFSELSFLCGNGTRRASNSEVPCQEELASPSTVPWVIPPSSAPTHFAELHHTPPRPHGLLWPTHEVDVSCLVSCVSAIVTRRPGSLLVPGGG